MELIFDSHAHYDDKAFAKDREELLSGLRDNGVGYVMNICAEYDGIKAVLELADRYDFIYAAAGVHPTEVYDLTEDHRKSLQNLILNGNAGSRIRAVGETGLDYHYPDTDKKKQQDWFAFQMELARKAELPVVIHSRDAAKDTLDMVRAEHGEACGGVMHCFSYGTEIAKQYLDMGFYLGIGGVITFKNSRRAKEVVEMMPVEQMLLETDCPYLAPEPFRGKRNDSTLLHYVAEEAARIKKISKEELIEKTTANAKRLYRI